MRNLLTLVILFLLFSVHGEAQTFRFRSGLNFASMSSIELSYPTGVRKWMAPGFHFGISKEFPFSESLALETGLLLTNKGGVLRWKDGHRPDWDEDAVIRRRFSSYYMEIPLTMKVSKTSDKGRMIYGELGPYFSIGLCEIKKDTRIEGDRDISFHRWYHGSRLDYGITLGGGFYKNSIRYGLAFDLGLAGFDTIENKYIRNRVLRLTIVYSFRRK